MSSRIERIDGVLVYNGKHVPPGPWQAESDHVDFEADGFACILHRNFGWCGYVAVPPGHPWHGKNCDELDVRVHGGLTYSEMCSGEICHVAKPGEPDDVWWLGFDCSHSGDLTLYDIADGNLAGFGNDIYRDVEYVRRETQRLAAQAKAAQL